ncbi:MAG: 50S ribosomal protein L32 [Caldisericales bacterium]|jgi:large subunit ribosomal protein L32|nr:50S ribosomal protein L32 [Caldisericia bacterium]MBP6928644.1 50S ribosomal protein L32 [Caldisericia bacterium]MCE5176491.1 50S ribosomal protein L32 [bacterium]
MPEPKKKVTPRRSRLRRAHQKIDVPALVECKNCGKMTRAHHVCAYCGFYNGELVVVPKVKKVKTSKEEQD